MKRKYTTIACTLILSVIVTFSQQRYTKFADLAEYYASNNLSIFRFNLSQNFAVANFESLNSFYSQFGSNWGNVIMALSISKVSGHSMGKMLAVYNRTKPTDWDKIATELVTNKHTQDSLNSLIDQQISSWHLN